MLEDTAHLQHQGQFTILNERLGLTRREFVRSTIAAGIVLGTAAAWAADTKSNLPYRALGRTGEKVSLIGLGGYHLGLPPETEAIRITRAAVDRGVNFLDNCWDYNNGASEERMGKALRDGYRDKVFLMTKIDARTKPAAVQQIDQSLQRLQTDRIDLMQIHEVIRLEDPDRIFAPGGSMEALLEAKKAGKIRFIGFTGHKDPLVHLRMLEVAAANKFHFDAAQMPLNVMDAHFRSFAQKVVPALVQEGIGVLGMKPLANGMILKSNTVSPRECFHYAMNLPTATVITGIDRMELLDQALDAARTFKPLSKPEVDALLARTADAAASGQFETFKTTAGYDATAHHPQWMG
jgi:predicted aldo/keto reductase-like oxidoreductase